MSPFRSASEGDDEGLDLPIVGTLRIRTSSGFPEATPMDHFVHPHRDNRCIQPAHGMAALGVPHDGRAGIGILPGPCWRAPRRPELRIGDNECNSSSLTAGIAMPLNIGEAAAASGVSAKMIRHYEAVGMLPPARRTESGYRTYDDADVHSLRFVRHARDHGFSIKEISELLSLWHNRRRPSKAVKALTSRHIADLDRKIRELEQMKRALQTLAERCAGDDRPHCPILEGLAGERHAAHH